MLTIAVANLKGGCGKTTLSTNLAAVYARAGLRTVLVDADRQRCAAGWVESRADSLPLIEVSIVDRDEIEVPKKSLYAVIDAPAGLRRKEIEAIAAVADIVLVPVGPSSFDEAGTVRFLEALAEAKAVRKARTRVALVANRVRPRTAALTRLNTFLGSTGFPVVGQLSESLIYANAAATGCGLVDLPGKKHAKLIEEWKPLLAWINLVITEND
jgi:chromosome partitioning protein